jgi:hypothetical protein
MVKTCTKCHETKTEDSFAWHYKDKGMRRAQCKTCRNNYEKIKGREEHRKVQRKNYCLNKSYSINLEEYEAMLEKQKGVCDICHRPPSTRALAVDHCHSTGVIRGLLCGLCNTALGSMQDNPDRLRAAALYLERFMND